MEAQDEGENVRREKPVTLYNLHTLLFIPIAPIYP